MAVPDCTELLAWDWAYEVRSEMQIEALYVLYEKFIHIQAVKILAHDNRSQLQVRRYNYIPIQLLKF